MNKLIVIEYLNGVISDVHCTGENYRVILHDVDLDTYKGQGLYEAHFEYLFPASKIGKDGPMAQDIANQLWQGEIK